MDVMIRIAGEAGQGLKTIGDVLVQSLSRSGLSVFATRGYMSRIRGGLNWLDLRVADRVLVAPRERTDILVAMSDEALKLLRQQLTDGGLVIYNGEKPPDDIEDADKITAIDFNQIAKDVAESTVMANTVAAGVVYGVLGWDCDHLCDYLRQCFSDEEVARKNADCARRGFELGEAIDTSVEAPAAQGGDHSGEIINGAEAVGLAAAVAGVKFVAAYPMTPATGTFTYLAKHADEHSIVVEQAEDEIAAVNMVCGAAYAGVPAMTMTSGGGFALMTEGLSLAGIMELPLVILIAQRPGPATGLPTRTSQQDLLFALSAGHGEFPRIVFAPGSHKQCYALTRRAIELAHQFQTPAIILTDQFLQDAETNTPDFDLDADPIDRYLATDVGEDYVRYALTESGVSPRAIPGGAAFIICDSDEHDQAGHISEDLNGHLDQHDKRMRKLDGLTDQVLEPELYGDEGADTLLVCWGSTYGPCREAVDRLREEGESIAMLHAAQVWPLRADAFAKALKGRNRVVNIEANSTAQFASLLRQVQVLGPCENILRYDGLPFTADSIVDALRKQD